VSKLPPANPQSAWLCDVPKLHGVFAELHLREVNLSLIWPPMVRLLMSALFCQKQIRLPTIHRRAAPCGFPLPPFACGEHNPRREKSASSYRLMDWKSISCWAVHSSSMSTEAERNSNQMEN
jgi:hypothetical protein